MPIDFPSLRHILPYVRLFRDKVVVIKLSGDLCERITIMDHLLEQIAFLKSIGIQMVIVHGGGKHATQLGEKLNVHSEFVAGRRITSNEMLEVVKMSFAGKLNTDIIARLKKQGVTAVGLSGIDGDLINATKRPPIEVMDPEKGHLLVDYGYVADIEAVDINVVLDLLEGGYLPVICSLAADSDGQILNLNADTLATEIAIHLQAEKLCILSNVDGVMRDINDSTSLFSLLSTDQVKQLIHEKIIGDGMLPKLTSSIAALENGVSSVHIINGQNPDALLKEIFTNEGVGTMLMPG